MLNDLDESLRALLVQDLPRVTERIEASGFDISFEVPNRDFRSRLTRPTLSLYLYNIQENRDFRGRVWPVARHNGSVTTRRPAVRLDCQYMITAWSNEVEDEHRLLTGATRVLFRNPVLPPDILQGGLSDGYEITTEVAQPDNFKDVVDIWTVLDNDLHPSVRVTVTIPLELDVEYNTPSVSGHDIGIDSPNWHPGPTSPIRFEGRVEQEGKPVQGALIRIDYSSTHTDDRGEFALNNVTPGKQLVWIRMDNTFYQMEGDIPKDRLFTLPPGANVEPQAEGSPGPDKPGEPPPQPPGPTGGRRNRRSTSRNQG